MHVCCEQPRCSVRRRPPAWQALYKTAVVDSGRRPHHTLNCKCVYRYALFCRHFVLSVRRGAISSSGRRVAVTLPKWRAVAERAPEALSYDVIARCAELLLPVTWTGNGAGLSVVTVTDRSSTVSSAGTQEKLSGAHRALFCGGPTRAMVGVRRRRCVVVTECLARACPARRTVSVADFTGWRRSSSVHHAWDSTGHLLRSNQFDYRSRSTAPSQRH